MGCCWGKQPTGLGRQAQDKMIWQRVLAGPVKDWILWEGLPKEENLCCVETVSQRLREGTRTSQGKGKICLKTRTSLVDGSIVLQEEQQRGRWGSDQGDLGASSGT